MLVRAPATTANLGPGFDCLGAALNLYLEVEAEPADATLVTAEGELAGAIPEGEDNLILRAARLTAPDLSPLRLRVRSEIPLGRGLGSSSAAIAAGLLLGCALAGRDPDPAELLEIGLPLEGHPDNLAPCLYGGLVLVVADGPVMRFDPSPAVRPAILVPHKQLSTKTARSVLPESVPFADAILTASRTAGLLAVLAGLERATAENLLACTDDVLHQPYRATLMAETAHLIRTLRDRGVPAVVSGAGPSVLCLLTDDSRDGFDAVRPELDGWTVKEVEWDASGARILADDDG